MRFKVLLWFIVPWLAACTSSQTILVIDSGFDQHHAVFAGRVVAVYQLECDDNDSAPPWTSFEDARRQLLAEYLVADTACRIVERDDFAPSEAYRTRPLSSFEQDLLDVIERHGVTIINKSYGPVPRLEYERLLDEASCPRVDLTRDYLGTDRWRAAREDHLRSIAAERGLAWLTVQSAGNSGAVIDDASQARFCDWERRGYLLVGALDWHGRMTDFTNHGACVDVYAIGLNVISAAPRDFVRPNAGTSMSAPLIARFISRHSSRAWTPDKGIAMLEDAMVPMTRNLDLEVVSSDELIWAPYMPTMNEFKAASPPLLLPIAQRYPSLRGATLRRRLTGSEACD